MSTSQRTATKFHRTKVEGIYFRLKANGTKTFYIRYTDHTGKRTWSACESFEHAKHRLAEVTGKKATGAVVADPTATLSDLLPGWRAQRDSIAKVRSRETEERNLRLYIEPRWGRVKVRDIRPNAITTWINSLCGQGGNPLAESTRALVLAHLSGLLSYAVEEGVVGSNAVKAMPRRSKPQQGQKVARTLRDGELAKLLGSVGKQGWLAPILRLLSFTGLRLGEVVGLQWGDVDFEAETITVRRQIGKTGVVGTPKSGKERVVPLMGDAKAVLALQRTEVAKQRLALGLGAITKDTPVFTNSYGGHRQPRDVQRAFDWARDRAKLSEEPRRLTLHDFRHTVATVLANEPGAVLPRVQAMLGHSDIKITMGYVHDRTNEAWRQSGGAALAAALA